jgi:hypothetical protein
MANAIYPKYKQNLLAGTTGYDLDVNDTTNNPYCALVDTGVYIYNVAHDMRDDLSGVAGTDQMIASPTVVDGTFDGGDVTFPLVAAGAAIEALVIYRKNGGATSTQPLVAFLDTLTGLPVTPNGGNINVTWHASGIFTL